MGGSKSKSRVDVRGTSETPNKSDFSYITVEEVVPFEKSFLAKKNESWHMSFSKFNFREEDKKMPRNVRRFYEEQDELVKTYMDHLEGKDVAASASANRRGFYLAKISFGINSCLLVSKSVAAYLTGSLAVLTSVMDSFVDLISGSLLWWSGRAIRKRDPYQYPGGRSRLEPFSIVILSVIMSLCSLAMVRESIETIIEYVSFDRMNKTGVNESSIFCFNISQMKEFVDTHHDVVPDFQLDSILICCSTVLIKFILFVVCRATPAPVAQTLAQDHRNDVVSNTGALGFGLLAAYVWKYFDAAGALIICIYIITTWFITGYQQMLLLTGYTARPEILKKLTFLSVNHHRSILAIKTLRAFHFGNEFLVEVDIILPKDMPVKEAHAIALSLEKRLEKLEEVERVFVRIDTSDVYPPNEELHSL